MHKSINLRLTLVSTVLLSLAGVIVAFIIQSQASYSVNSCSYLDPLIVDIWAMVFAVFLILEGYLDIFRYCDYPLKKQITKSIRIGIGFAISTIHIMQFLHK